MKPILMKPEEQITVCLGPNMFAKPEHVHNAHVAKDLL